MTTTVPYNDVFYGISALISVTFFMGDNAGLAKLEAFGYTQATIKLILIGSFFMSVPAKRRSSSAKGRRRSHDALVAVKLIRCKKCNKLTRPHQACPACGSYQGREVVSPKVKKQRSAK